MLCERLDGRTGILLNWNISRSAPAYILFIYRNVKRKQTQKVNPMIEMKKEEIYELCEKGINVNIKMYIFDHLRMYIFAILPLDRYIFLSDKIFL